METSKEFLTGIKKDILDINRQAVLISLMCAGVVALWISFIY